MKSSLTALGALLGASLALGAPSPDPMGSVPIRTLPGAIDRDGSDCVSLEEGRNDTSRRFHSLDANLDGQLDDKESPLGPMEGPDDRPITLEDWQDSYHAQFDRFDTDGDRCLSPTEVTRGRADAHARMGRPS
jgi:hypothetical protein